MSQGSFYINVIDNAVLVEGAFDDADTINESYRNLNAVFRRIKELEKEFKARNIAE